MNNGTTLGLLDLSHQTPLQTERAPRLCCIKTLSRKPEMRQVNPTGFREHTRGFGGCDGRACLGSLLPLDCLCWKRCISLLWRSRLAGSGSGCLHCFLVVLVVCRFPVSEARFGMPIECRGCRGFLPQGSFGTLQKWRSSNTAQAKARERCGDDAHTKTLTISTAPNNTSPRGRFAYTSASPTHLSKTMQDAMSRRRSWLPVCCCCLTDESLNHLALSQWPDNRHQH